MVKAVIFDFDGTLADSFDVIIGIFQSLAKHKQPLTQAEILELKDKNLAEAIKQLGISRWRIPKLLFRGRRLMIEKIDHIEPFVGIVEMLDTLKQNGYELFITSTNHGNSIERFLKNHSMDGDITEVYGDIGVTGKARSLSKLIKSKSYSTEEYVYVGDETRDIEAAHKIGIKCIAVGWGFNSVKALSALRPTAIIASPNEMLEAVKKLS
jgi:phosphoglycolate phosphatase-like HAD superfamily hydrolase